MPGLAEGTLVSRLFRMGGAVMAIFALAACGGTAGSSRAPTNLPGTLVDAPQGALSSPVWLADGWTYVVLDDPKSGPDNEVWRTKTGGKAERVTLPDESGCRRTTVRNLQALPDGRLGLGRWCSMEDPKQDYFDLVAYDPATARMEPLAVLGGTPASDVAWAPGLREGYVSHGTGICAGIARLSRDGAGRMAEPVTFDGHTWVVDFTWFRQAGAVCTDDGRVERPVLRKDGKSLLLFASPTSQGKEGDSRMDQPWNLYQWTPGVGQPAPVAKGFGDPLGAWLAPDDRSLIVATRRESQYGVWRIDAESGSVTQLALGRSVGVTVSPDGKQLAAVFQPRQGRDYDLDHTELRVLNIG
jgi:hypothetical protein